MSYVGARTNQAIYRPEAILSSDPEITIKLDCNENPHGPSVKVLNDIQSQLSNLNRYPDTHCRHMKKCLVRTYGLTEGHYTLGNGSDTILEALFTIFLNDGKSLITPEHDFIGAFHLSKSHHITHLKVNMPNGICDVDSIANATDDQVGVIFLSNPNNPFGTSITLDDIRHLISSIPSNILIIVDEAYIEYADQQESALTLVDEFPNVFVLRTFSKFFALAGLRVGVGIGHPKVIAQVESFRLPFVVNSLGLRAAQIALSDTEHQSSTRAQNEKWRNYLLQELRNLSIQTYPSQTNFVTINLQEDATPLHSHLRQHGILVKHLKSQGLTHCLRLSIGNEFECQFLIKMISEFTP